MEADFEGWATKSGLRCTDGRTIMPDAFKHQDQLKVPLVWQHGHSDPENVLGHAILESRPEGVYCRGFFNKEAKSQHAKGLVMHKDITALSIWANQLIEKSKMVTHGVIREVSLVLSGANPGAVIEKVAVAHSDGDVTELDDEAIIYTGLEFQHSAEGPEPSDQNLEHDGGDPTVQEVYDTLNEDQKNLVNFMLGEAIATAGSSSDNAAHGETNQEGTAMHQNVFENKDTKNEAKGYILTHEDKTGIFADATKMGSMSDAVDAFCVSHGIDQQDILFPEAKSVNGEIPEFLKRRTEWVDAFLGATTKTPFSKIKNMWANITEADARAKGYITGNLKKEEFFGVAKRTTSPTTVYKKQKMDRDDVLDITDFDVISWLKMEMRIMLDEEIARAALIGDGRDIASEDKIDEQCIRPITKEHELFASVVNLNLDDANSSIQEFVDAMIVHRPKYKGSGLPTLYTSESVISAFLLLKDGLNRDMYRTVEEVAAKLRVREIVPVEVFEEAPEIVGILVNPADYTFGANKGGEVTMFDDFDIDYNQQKYLIETRCCGCLTKLKSAIVFKKVAGANVLVTPTAPTFDQESGEVTITNTTHVVYKDDTGTTINAAGSPYTVDDGETYVVHATPATGYYFVDGDEKTWSFYKRP